MRLDTIEYASPMKDCADTKFVLEKSVTTELICLSFIYTGVVLIFHGNLLLMLANIRGNALM